MAKGVNQATIARRRDEVIRHMLTTPPKPQAEMQPPKRPYRKAAKAAADRQPLERASGEHV